MQDLSLRHFSYDHLPQELQTVSKLFHDLAVDVTTRLPASHQTQLFLDHLLMAKDAAVRAAREGAM